MKQSRVAEDWLIILIKEHHITVSPGSLDLLLTNLKLLTNAKEPRTKSARSKQPRPRRSKP